MSSHTKIPHYYWDACVFTALLKDEAGRAAIVEDWMTRARAGDLKIVTSAFSAVEVAKGNPTASNDEQERSIARLFSQPYIMLVNATTTAAGQARQLVRESGIKPADALHYATALYVRDTLKLPLMRFESYDDGLLSKLEQLAHGVECGHPRERERQTELLDADLQPAPAEE